MNFVRTVDVQMQSQSQTFVLTYATRTVPVRRDSGEGVDSACFVATNEAPAVWTSRNRDNAVSEAVARFRQILTYPPPHHIRLLL